MLNERNKDWSHDDDHKYNQGSGADFDDFYQDSDHDLDDFEDGIDDYIKYQDMLDDDYKLGR